MKKIIFISFIICGLLLSACGKEKKNKQHIVGKWDIERCDVEGKGQLLNNDDYTEIIFEFLEGGEFRHLWQIDGIETDSITTFTYTEIRTGTWEVTKTTLTMTYDDNPSPISISAGTSNRKEVYNSFELNRKDMIELSDTLNGKFVIISGKYSLSQ